MSNHIQFKATTTPNQSFTFAWQNTRIQNADIQLQYAYIIQTQHNNNWRQLRLTFDGETLDFYPTNPEDPESGDLIGYPLLIFELPKLILNRDSNFSIRTSFGGKLNLIAKRIKVFDALMT